MQTRQERSPARAQPPRELKPPPPPASVRTRHTRNTHSGRASLYNTPLSALVSSPFIGPLLYKVQSAEHSVSFNVSI